MKGKTRRTQGPAILKRSDVFISSLNKKLQPLSVEPWVAGAGWGAKWELEFCVYLIPVLLSICYSLQGKTISICFKVFNFPGSLI